MLDERALKPLSFKALSVFGERKVRNVGFFTGAEK
jgi:hypothetical protein